MLDVRYTATHVENIILKCLKIVKCSMMLRVSGLRWINTTSEHSTRFALVFRILKIRHLHTDTAVQIVLHLNVLCMELVALIQFTLSSIFYVYVCLLLVRVFDGNVYSNPDTFLHTHWHAHTHLHFPALLLRFLSSFCQKTGECSISTTAAAAVAESNF